MFCTSMDARHQELLKFQKEHCDAPIAKMIERKHLFSCLSAYVSVPSSDYCGIDILLLRQDASVMAIQLKTDSGYANEPNKGHLNYMVPCHEIDDNPFIPDTMFGFVTGVINQYMQPCDVLLQNVLFVDLTRLRAIVQDSTHIKKMQDMSAYKDYPTVVGHCTVDGKDYYMINKAYIESICNLKAPIYCGA